MGRTSDIACLQCKHSLWIGQYHYLYTGEGDTMKALDVFLQVHRGHPLVFDHDVRIEDLEGDVKSLHAEDVLGTDPSDVLTEHEAEIYAAWRNSKFRNYSRDPDEAESNTDRVESLMKPLWLRMEGKP